MRIVNIRDAKTQLSNLVDQAANGEPFIISKAGKPMVTGMPVNARVSDQVKRLGFMAEQITVPDDFDRMGHEEIIQLFGSFQ